MKNLKLFFARHIFKSSFWILILSSCSFAFAQKPSAVQYSKTDKVFANTTEIYKSKNATDVQILTEVEKEYGLGDVIRIKDVPPPESQPITKSLPNTKTAIAVQASVSLPQASSTLIVATKAPMQNTNDDRIASNVILEPTLLNIQPEKIESNPVADSPVVEMTSDIKEEATLSQERKSREVKTSNRVSKSSNSYKTPRVKSSSKKKWLTLFSKRSKPSKAIYAKKKNKFGCYRF